MTQTYQHAVHELSQDEAEEDDEKVKKMKKPSKIDWRSVLAWMHTLLPALFTPRILLEDYVMAVSQFSINMWKLTNI